MIRKKEQDQKFNNINILYNRIINEKNKKIIINNVNTSYNEIINEKKEKSSQSIKLIFYIIKLLMKCYRR